MTTRRQFLKASLLGAGASALSSDVFADANASVGPPTRFIFVHKGNGLLPKAMVPTSFGGDLLAKEKKKQAYEVELAEHELPAWMSPLENHKQNMTILQGLSGKMCTTGHHTCLLYTSPSPRDLSTSRMPSSA